ncbi:hypothetical protein D7V94_13765 [Parablautia intestinalis]|uniref:Uncharacterized protein n=1 Tax=Parablautia intestinalis TaxID=2320100 RepID=A0A3A9AGG6_9FIRM|nr:hypothetical protein D7V94_13765 [Parablautia intestinalis]
MEGAEKSWRKRQDIFRSFVITFPVMRDMSGQKSICPEDIVEFPSQFLWSEAYQAEQCCRECLILATVRQTARQFGISKSTVHMVVVAK